MPSRLRVPRPPPTGSESEPVAYPTLAPSMAQSPLMRAGASSADQAREGNVPGAAPGPRFGHDFSRLSVFSQGQEADRVAAGPASPQTPEAASSAGADGSTTLLQREPAGEVAGGAAAAKTSTGLPHFLDPDFDATGLSDTEIETNLAMARNLRHDPSADTYMTGLEMPKLLRGIERLQAERDARHPSADNGREYSLRLLKGTGNVVERDKLTRLQALEELRQFRATIVTSAENVQDAREIISDSADIMLKIKMGQEAEQIKTDVGEALAEGDAAFADGNVEATQKAYQAGSNIAHQGWRNFMGYKNDVDDRFETAINVLTRIEGAGKVAQAGLEAAGAAALYELPGAQGLATALLLHASDVGQAGLRQAGTGERKDTLTKKAASAGMQAVGVSEDTSNEVAGNFDSALSMFGGMVPGVAPRMMPGMKVPGYDGPVPKGPFDPAQPKVNSGTSPPLYDDPPTGSPANAVTTSGPPKVTITDADTPLSSGGYQSTIQGKGNGVYAKQIPEFGPEPVTVKIYPENMDAKFQQDLAGAQVAEKTGYGPKVYGEVDAGPGKRAYAMEKLEGGLPDSASGAKPAEVTEAGHWASKISDQTLADLNGYRDSLWKQGYYYKGEVQGFVNEGGRWRPMDFQAIEKIPTDPVGIMEAWETHQRNFASEADLWKLLKP